MLYRGKKLHFDSNICIHRGVNERKRQQFGDLTAKREQEGRRENETGQMDE